MLKVYARVLRASVVGGTESDGTVRYAGSVYLYRRVVVGERVL
jgi:hypothetical protein